MSNVLENSGNIEDILERDGVYPTVTVGTSMRPLFKTHRDMIILESICGEIKKYDVVLYRVGEKYVLHRVIGIDKDSSVYIIRGDNTFKKEYIPRSSILARLTSFTRRGKRHKVDDRGYRAYSVIWNFIYPVRYVFNLGMRIAKKLYRKIFRKSKK